MAKKTIKYRRYPSFALLPQLSVAQLEIQVQDISAFEFERSASDTSIGRSSKTSVWLTGDARYRVKDITFESVLRQKEREFVELLLAEDFSDSVRNESTIYVSRLRRGHKNDVSLWFQALYQTHQDDDYFIMQLFRLFRCFPYDYFQPSSLTLAGLGVHHTSDFVKSEAISLLDHWGNADVFNLLNYHEPPETPWLKAKYISVRNSLERYAAIQKDRRDTMV